MDDVKPLSAEDLNDGDGPLLALEFDVILATRKGKRRLTARTEGWEEADYAWREQNPPPVPKPDRERIKDPLELAKIGETGGQPVIAKVYDWSNPRYLLAKERWSDARAYNVAAHVLQLPGSVEGDRVAFLKKIGLASYQAHAIFNQARAMSMIAEEAAVDFTDGSSEPDGSENSGSDCPPDGSP